MGERAEEETDGETETKTERWGKRARDGGSERGRQEGERDSDGRKEGPNKAGSQAVLRGLEWGQGAGLRQEGQRQTVRSRGYGHNNQREKLSPEKG